MKLAIKPTSAKPLNEYRLTDWLPRIAHEHSQRFGVLSGAAQNHAALTCRDYAGVILPLRSQRSSQVCSSFQRNTCPLINRQLRSSFAIASMSAGANSLPMTPRRLLSMFRGFAERSEEHTSELQSLRHLVCRLLLE